MLLPVAHCIPAVPILLHCAAGQGMHVLCSCDVSAVQCHVLVPMMQLSHCVFWMPSSSWIIQRVEATDCAKQQETCSRHDKNGAHRSSKGERMVDTRRKAAKDTCSRHRVEVQYQLAHVAHMLLRFTHSCHK